MTSESAHITAHDKPPHDNESPHKDTDPATYDTPPRLDTVWRGSHPTNIREQIGERLYNLVITHVPSHTVRQAWLRIFGATIGKRTSIMMGTRVLGLQQLSIGDHCSIGFRCLLDARGGIVIGDNVVIASEVQIISGHHLVDSDDFLGEYSPVHIGHHAWIASRATIVDGLDIGSGAVVGAQSLVLKGIPDMGVVGGIPATRLGTRSSALAYQPDYRPILY